MLQRIKKTKKRGIKDRRQKQKFQVSMTDEEINLVRAKDKQRKRKKSKN